MPRKDRAPSADKIRTALLELGVNPDYVKQALPALSPPGRPKIPVTAEELERLGQIDANKKQVAAWFTCTERTIDNHFKREPELKEAYERGVELGNTALKRAGHRAAVGDKPNPRIWMFLMTNRTEYQAHRAVEVTGPNGGPLQFDADIGAALVERLRTFIKSRSNGEDRAGSA